MNEAGHLVEADTRSVACKNLIELLLLAWQATTAPRGRPQPHATLPGHEAGAAPGFLPRAYFTALQKHL